MVTNSSSVWQGMSLHFNCLSWAGIDQISENTDACVFFGVGLQYFGMQHLLRCCWLLVIFSLKSLFSGVMSHSHCPSYNSVTSNSHFIACWNCNSYKCLAIDQATQELSQHSSCLLAPLAVHFESCSIWGRVWLFADQFLGKKKTHILTVICQSAMHLCQWNRTVFNRVLDQ